MHTGIVFIALAVIIFVTTTQFHTVDTYRVNEVLDGDTIIVNMEGQTDTIRLIGVDTSETKDQRKEVQCYGPEASAYTHAQLTNVRVRLVADPLGTNRDRYDRLLRYVYTQDGTLYNESLLQKGYARPYTGFLFS